VLINLPDDPDHCDPFHLAGRDTHDAPEQAGLSIDIIPDRNKRRVTSIDFVACYGNYYARNGAIIAARFGDPDTDTQAVGTLQRHYPTREIITAMSIRWPRSAAVDCATQQMPA